MSRTDRTPWFELVGLLVITLLAFALRLPGLDAQGLWHDELYTLGNLAGFDLYLFPGADLAHSEPIRSAGYWVVQLSRDSFWVNLWRNLVHEGHPPLYLFLLKTWTGLVGSSEVKVRLFSVIASTMAVPAMFLAGRRLGGRAVAVLAASLLAVTPFQVHVSYEARYYGLLVFMATAATWAALELRAVAPAPRRGTWAAWLLLGTGLCFSHYFGALYCLLLLALLIWPAHGERKRFFLSCPNAVATLPMALFSLWLPVLYLQTRSHGTGHWTQGHLGFIASVEAAATGVLELISSPQLSAPPAELWFVIGLLLLCLVVTLWSLREDHDKLPLRLLATIPIHALVVFTVDAMLDHHTIAVARYSSCLAIPITLLIAFSLARLRTAGVTLAGVFVLLSLQASIATIRGDRAPRQMLREAASYINTHATPQDLVVVTPSGPSLIGVAFYLDPATPVCAVPAADLRTIVEDLDRSPGQKIWSVQQHLGLEYESWADPTTPPSEHTVRFAGLDLVTY